MDSTFLISFSLSFKRIFGDKVIPLNFLEKGRINRSRGFYPPLKRQDLASVKTEETHKLDDHASLAPKASLKPGPWVKWTCRVRCINGFSPSWLVKRAVSAGSVRGIDARVFGSSVGNRGKTYARAATRQYPA